MKLFYGTFQSFGQDTKLASGLNMGPFFFIGFDPYEVLYTKTGQFNLQRTPQNVLTSQSYLGLK
jgi:hypothetical protein